MTDAKTFDAIIDAGNTEPSKEKTFPWKKVEPYVPMGELVDVLNGVNSYRSHPRTKQFVQAMSNKSKEPTNVQ